LSEERGADETLGEDGDARDGDEEREDRGRIIDYQGDGAEGIDGVGAEKGGEGLGTGWGVGGGGFGIGVNGCAEVVCASEDTDAE